MVQVFKDPQFILINNYGQDTSQLARWLVSKDQSLFVASLLISFPSCILLDPIFLEPPPMDSSQEDSSHQHDQVSRTPTHSSKMPFLNGFRRKPKRSLSLRSMLTPEKPVGEAPGFWQGMKAILFGSCMFDIRYRLLFSSNSYMSNRVEYFADLYSSIGMFHITA